MQEVFDFAQCADPDRSILWNIESKIDPTAPEKTKGVREFVERQHGVFEKSGYKGSIVVSEINNKKEIMTLEWSMLMFFSLLVVPEL